MFRTPRLIVLCIALLTAFASPVFASTLEEMVRMADQLDQLDKADFNELINRAAGCTKRRDFNCAETGLAKAAKLVRDNLDRTALAQAHERIGKERGLMRQEIEEERAAELRRQEEEEKQVAQAERESQCENYCSTQGGISACYRGQIDPWYCSTYEARSSGGPNYGAAILQGFNQTLQGHARITAIHDQAMANLKSAQEERARERQQQQANQRAQMAQAAQERRAAQQSARDSERQTQRTGSSPSTSNGGESVAAMNERSAAAQRERSAEQRRRDEQDAQERRAREQQEREESKQRQLAERQAQRDAQAAEQAQAKAGYLSQMQSSIRLMARQCFGGQYIVGTRPRIKPEVVSCVDVHYRAQCTTASNNHFIDGVGKTFVGMGTDCFSGDTYPIEPKLSCDVKDIRVTLREVRACNE